MKTQIKSFMLLVILGTMLSCNGFAQESTTPTIVKTFNLDRPGSLNARSSGGGVVVRTHDQDIVEVQVYVRKNGRTLSPSDPAADDVLRLYNLEIEKKGTAITANVDRKIRNSPWENVGISLVIIVPREMSCNVSSSGGGLKISGVSGTHNFTSSGGGVELENISGTTRASSSGGRVTVADQNGDVHLSSSGGGVTLDGAHGVVYAHSSGGGVRLINIHGDVDAGSSGGGVTISGVSGSVKATSSGGSVHINITNLTKELYLQSSGGGIDATIGKGKNLGLDLDLSSDKVNIELHNFSGRVEKNRVKGTLNGGGIPVYMHSSGGNINVKFDEQE